MTQKLGGGSKECFLFSLGFIQTSSDFFNLCVDEVMMRVFGLLLVFFELPGVEGILWRRVRLQMVTAVLAYALEFARFAHEPLALLSRPVDSIADEMVVRG